MISEQSLRLQHDEVASIQLESLCTEQGRVSFSLALTSRQNFNGRFQVANSE